MTLDVLAIMGGSSALAALGAIIYLIYKYVGVSESRDHLRDLLETKDTLIEQARSERDGLQAQFDAVSAQLKTERDLRAVAESQRNDALKQGVQHAVDQILASDLAGAADLGNRILRSPLPRMPSLASANGGGQGAGVQPAKPAA